jgi:hypothetical protein
MQAQMRQMQEAHENEIAQMNERDKACDIEIAQICQMIEPLVLSSLTRNQFVAQRTDGQDIPNTASPCSVMAKSSVASQPGDVS